MMEKTATRRRRGRARIERTTSDVEKGGISKLLALAGSTTWSLGNAAAEFNLKLPSELKSNQLG